MMSSLGLAISAAFFVVGGLALIVAGVSGATRNKVHWRLRVPSSSRRFSSAQSSNNAGRREVDRQAATNLSGSST